MKAPQLSVSDKRAVDMLLDELAQTSLDETTFAVSSNVASPQSLQAARTILAHLDHLEAGEPALDLVARSMARIERAVRNGEVANPGVENGISQLMSARVDA